MNSEEIKEIAKLLVKNMTTLSLDIALAILANKTINRYQLIRDNRVEKCKFIQTPEYLKTTRKENLEAMPKELENIVYEALTRLSFDISPESMEIIKKNLTSLTDNSNYINSIKQYCISAAGMYNLNKHTISINKFITFFNKESLKQIEILKRQILSHELMHAASSHKYGNKRISGFYFSSKNHLLKKITIGIGINEGYTDLISQRYFCKEKNRKVGYSYHRVISEIIENIVGKQKMINLYFHGDLNSLIEELAKYSSREKAEQVITDLDSVLKIIRTPKLVVPIGKEDLLKTCLNRINLFLYNAFNNKTKNYTSLEYLKESKKFIELFSNIEKEESKMFGNKKSNHTNIPKTKITSDNSFANKPKVLKKKKDGYVNTFAIIITLEAIAIVSTIITYLILK